MKSPNIMIYSNDCDATAVWIAGLSVPVKHVLSVAHPGAGATDGCAGMALAIVDLHDAGAGEQMQPLEQQVLCTVQRLRAQTNAPILCVSPVDAPDHVVDAYEAGVDEYIVRPVSQALLAAKINAWLRWTGRPGESMASRQFGAH